MTLDKHNMEFNSQNVSKQHSPQIQHTDPNSALMTFPALEILDF